MRYFAGWLMVCLLCLLQSQTGLAQQRAARRNRRADQSAMQREINALKEGQRRILSELEELKRMLQARDGGTAALPAAAAPAQPLPPAEIALNADEPFRGGQRARVAIIEYSDFQCPFCGSYSRETYPQLDENYLKTGKVKYVFRDFPLPMHPHAEQAAEAARCAGEQSKFWEMHDRLFANQEALAASDLFGHARALGLDTGKFNQCMMSKRHAGQIRESMREGERLGIDGTPAFLIAVARPGSSQFKIVKLLIGAESYESFKTVLDEALRSQGK
ncbi:MAG TPA: thioredoxin domain-containing protein [Pyrinomonadaceae bacterium]|jgi:protein-disulfide isomerase